MAVFALVEATEDVSDNAIYTNVVSIEHNSASGAMTLLLSML